MLSLCQFIVFTIEQELHWNSPINTLVIHAGQRLGILRQVSHLLTIQKLSKIYKLQVRSVTE